MGAFLELPVFQPRASFAYATIGGRISLVRCAAPSIPARSDGSFSDISNLTELSPVDFDVLFSQLGVGHQEFRVPNLATLQRAYLRLPQLERRSFLRAAAYLFDCCDPTASRDQKIAAPVIAIEALLQADRRTSNPRRPKKIGPLFRDFMSKHVIPDLAVNELFDELYSFRSDVAHGASHSGVDGPLLGLPQDHYVATLVAWAAAKRGLIKWLLARSGQPQASNMKP